MVPVTAPDQFFWIDRFENSVVQGFAVSTPNGIPATSVTLSQAREFCISQGKRLCSETQWVNACLGDNRHAFAYAPSPEEGICNVNGQRLLPAGWSARCLANGRIFDMLGNAMEWVESDTDSGAGVLAGGSYRSGLTASCFTRRITTTRAVSEEAGFRCCAND